LVWEAFRVFAVDEVMMIVGVRQVPYQTRVGGKCAGKFMR